MANAANQGKLSNALLLLGTAALLFGLLVIANWKSRTLAETSPQVETTLKVTGTLAAPDGKQATSPRIVKSNTPLVTITASAIPTETPLAYLYSDKGDRIPITWEDYPGPSTWPSTPIPAPMDRIPIADDQVNILILGNDYRPRKGARTDMIILLSLNPGAGTASLTSFPRATYVYAPGWTMMPLHTVQPRGGYALLIDTFEYNFGVRPDHYINISMMNFESVVDSLGGIDVEVREYLSDPTYAGGKFSVEPGLVHMGGKMARWYARSRLTTSDFARAPRQQALLKAIFMRLIEIDAITRAPELYKKYIYNVVTDLSLADLINLAPIAVQLIDTSRVSQFAINLEQVEAWTTPRDHAYVFLPNREAVFELLLKALARRD